MLILRAAWDLVHMCLIDPTIATAFMSTYFHQVKSRRSDGLRIRSDA
jgi:hypothetical protein